MTKVNASQVRSSVPTQKAATPARTQQQAPAAQTAATKATGWAAGAGTQSLKITAARIGDGPKTTDTVQVPKGFKAELKDYSMKAEDTVHGEKVTLEQSSRQLTVTGPGGKKFTVGGGPESFKSLEKDWKDNNAATKKEPKPEWGMTGMSWDSQGSIGGAGTAGKMFSTIESGSDYTGGAHPNHGSIFRTYDATTGKQVKLDDLLSQKQINDLVKDIAAKLPKLKTADGEIDGTSFGGFDDQNKFIRDTINENFTLSADKSGKVKIDIAWESGIHALGGQMAHFTVDAPNDPGFRAKIGME